MIALERPPKCAAGHERDGNPLIVKWCPGCGCTAVRMGPKHMERCGWCDRRFPLGGDR